MHRVDDERQRVRVENRGRIRNLKMQVRRRGVSRIAQLGKLTSGAHMLADFHRNAARL
jgi:hypothetical protein